MRLILTIAWRNILRHKGKSLVIGGILFTGAFLMTLGNGVVAGMASGVEKNIISGFMGDIVLMSDKQKSDNILFNLAGSSIEPINTYAKIAPVLASRPYIAHYLPAGKSMAMLLSESTAAPGYAYLLGVDFSEYRKMFPDNFQVIEGSYPAPGERALLIPTFTREEFYNYYNIWFLPEGGRVVKKNLNKSALAAAGSLTVSSSVVMMGMSSGINATSDIRFPVRGIVKYGALNQIFGHFCLVDIESYRECLGYFTTADMAAQLPKEERKLLGLEGEELDAMFGAEEMLVSGRRAAPVIAKSSEEARKGSEGVYNVVFIRLRDGTSYKEAIRDLDAELGKAGAGVRAVAWSGASGPIGSMALIIKSALFVFVTLLFCVAVIIIVNTLTMSALERASELGMMRAIGARKNFIAGMFLGETAALSAIFGGLGIAAGGVAVKLIPLFHISTKNDMLQILYGGTYFQPLLSLSGIALTVVQLALVTVVAALYPMQVASRITPLDAVTRD